MIPALARRTGNRALKQNRTKQAALAAEGLLFNNWFDAIEDGVRSRVRDFIEALLEEELVQTLARPRYGRRRAERPNLRWSLAFAMVISFPDCPGCVAMGKDENEVFANAVEALAEWLGDLAPAKRPRPRSVVELRRDRDVNEQIRDGAIFIVVPFISDQGRATRANISMDAGLLEAIDETAKMLGLTRSSFLAQAAREKIGRTA